MKVRPDTPLVPSAFMGVCEENRGKQVTNFPPEAFAKASTLSDDGGTRKKISAFVETERLQARVEAVKLAVHWWKDRNGEVEDVITFAKALIACIEGRD